VVGFCGLKTYPTGTKEAIKDHNKGSNSYSPKNGAFNFIYGEGNYTTAWCVIKNI
jgi:hypothetical protein